MWSKMDWRLAEERQTKFMNSWVDKVDYQSANTRTKMRPLTKMRLFGTEVLDDGSGPVVYSSMTSCPSRVENDVDIVPAAMSPCFRLPNLTVQAHHNVKIVVDTLVSNVITNITQ
ncbi:hypothetical protein VNO78_23148 [Psophocarpus tetragonolobus]|uniref:Uncharacterized protein n=1 Tax=Psophocarpus tetragonolobus TaxID=3891 RepID=A0AAN9XE69_PSOTE